MKYLQISTFLIPFGLLACGQSAQQVSDVSSEKISNTALEEVLADFQELHIQGVPGLLMSAQGMISTDTSNGACDYNWFEKALDQSFNFAELIPTEGVVLGFDSQEHLEQFAIKRHQAGLGKVVVHTNKETGEKTNILLCAYIAPEASAQATSLKTNMGTSERVRQQALAIIQNEMIRGSIPGAISAGEGIISNQGVGCDANWISTTLDVGSDYRAIPPMPGIVIGFASHQHLVNFALTRHAIPYGSYVRVATNNKYEYVPLCAYVAPHAEAYSN